MDTKVSKEEEKRRQDLYTSAMRNHKKGIKHILSNADYVVVATGAWVRLTERNVSRKTHNNHCRRRLAKGK